VKKFIRVMKALSDPSRVKAIKMLSKKELCVCEIIAVLGLAQPTVSKHMKVLEDAGFVESWKEGAWVNYRLASGGESEYAKVMLGHLKAWLNDEQEVQDAKLKVMTVSRETIKAS